MSDPLNMPSPFYRVTTRAIIFDERMRLLIIEDDDGGYELPGGGWEHDESFEECMRREIKEELGVKTLYVGKLWFAYRGRRTNKHSWFLRMCAPVVLDTFDFKMGEGMKQALFVDRATFLNTTFTPDEEPIKDFVDDLWLPVEKNRKNK